MCVLFGATLGVMLLLLNVMIKRVTKMREFYGTFTMHFKRGVLSPIFGLCVGLCAIMMIFFVNGVYTNAYYTPPGLYYFLDRADKSGSVYLVMMIATFPAIMLFYDDWISGNFKFIITRVGRKKYAFAIMAAAEIIAAAVMILSYTIFTFYILLKFPTVPNMDSESLRASSFGFPNSGLLYTGHTFLCYLLYFLTRGAMAAFFAAIATFQSMIITNKHLTAISSVLFYILYFSFNLFYFLPTLLNPFVLFRNGYKLYLVFGGTEDGSLYLPIAGIYPMIFSAVVITILSLVGSKILRIKMNESI